MGEVFRLPQIFGDEIYDPINDCEFDSDYRFLKIIPRDVEIEDGIEAGHVATATAVALSNGMLVAFNENLEIIPLEAEVIIKRKDDYDVELCKDK